MTGTSAVEVPVRIAATPKKVFPYFTEQARYVQWMASEATLEPLSVLWPQPGAVRESGHGARAMDPL